MNKIVEGGLYLLAFLAALAGSSYVNSELLEARTDPNIRYATPEDTVNMRNLGSLEKKAQKEIKKKEIKGKKLSQLDSAKQYILDENGYKISSERAKDYAEWILKYSQEYGVPYDLALAIADHESDGFQNKTGDKNLKNGYPPSRGLFQINDSTQAMINRMRIAKGHKVKNIVGKEILKFPEKIIDDAIWFIAEMKRNNGISSFEETLARYYNPGMGQEYADKVKEKLAKVNESGVK